MTIHLGLWAIPLAVTLAVWAWAVLTPAEPSSAYSWDIMPALRGMATLFMSLVAWLVWALLR